MLRVLFYLTLVFLINGCMEKRKDSVAYESKSMKITGAALPTPPLSKERATSTDEVGGDILPMVKVDGKEVLKDGSLDKEVQSGTLTAGAINDSLNISFFKKYIDNTLQENKSTLPFWNFKDRIKIKVVDKNKNAINRAKIKINNFKFYTNSKGILYIYPNFNKFSSKTLTINGKKYDINSKEITLEQKAIKPKSLDLMFVIDTTGSMADEMSYLTKEFEDIINSINSKNKNISIRFGLVLYRDNGDTYVVKDFPFTSNLKTMQKQLQKQRAQGGGDYPEALERGLEKGLNANWMAKDGVRVLFLIADAPPHDKDIKKIKPLIKNAREKGVAIYPLGASGVAKKAEYIMRNLAFFTEGEYLFLTDDSGVGNSHQEPKVVCYNVSRLDHLIEKVIDSELKGKRVELNENQIIRRVGNYKDGICIEK